MELRACFFFPSLSFLQPPHSPHWLIGGPSDIGCQSPLCTHMQVRRFASFTSKRWGPHHELAPLLVLPASEPCPCP